MENKEAVDQECGLCELKCGTTTNLLMHWGHYLAEYNPFFFIGDIYTRLSVEKFTNDKERSLIPEN
jgi:hypothetical protein